MSSSAYYYDRYNYYLSNPPKYPSSYYNKDFVDKMNDARANIDNLVAEGDKAWSAVGQKQDDYNTFKGTTSTYGEIWEQNKSEFGIEQHQDNYEKSKKALAMAESTLAALPSSINAASNRVLTQSQKEARYNVLADRLNIRQNNLLAQNSAYEEAWKNAREAQASQVQNMMQQQQFNIENKQNSLVMAMNDYNQTQKNILMGKVELAEWQNQYSQWQQQQWQNAYDRWCVQVNNALEMYKQALQNETAQAEAQRIREQADLARNSSAVNSWDFGNGYTMKGSRGGKATYYFNGKQITAGNFVEGTGSYGANWDMWNDVWNAGVSTEGVGSDTIEAFNRRSSADSKWGYLFR